MKKKLIYALGIYLVLSAIISGGVLDALVSLVLAGAIPGTSYSIPADMMLLFWGVLAWLILVRIIILPFMRFGYAAHKPLIDQAKPINSATAKKKTAPKRRYSAVQKSAKTLKSAK